MSDGELTVLEGPPSAGQPSSPSDTAGAAASPMPEAEPADEPPQPLGLGASRLPSRGLLPSRVASAAQRALWRDRRTLFPPRDPQVTTPIDPRPFMDATAASIAKEQAAQMLIAMMAQRIELEAPTADAFKIGRRRPPQG